MEGRRKTGKKRRELQLEENPPGPSSPYKAACRTTLDHASLFFFFNRDGVETYVRDDATIFRQRQWQMHVGSGGHIEGQNDILYTGKWLQAFLLPCRPSPPLRARRLMVSFATASSCARRCSCSRVIGASALSLAAHAFSCVA